MNIFKSVAMGLFALCSITALSAVEIPDQFNVSGGYRNDTISNHSTISEPSGLTTVDHLRFDNIDLGVIGFDFRFTLPECNRCCEFPFLKNFYVDGNAYWGWSGSDDFDRTVTISVGDATTAFLSQGHQKAVTEDVQVALGYIVHDCDWWSVGVKGGYAYNYQRIHTTSGKTAVEATAAITDPVYSGLVFKQRWQGPWIGAEVFLAPCCDVLVNVGYEYHLTHFHASMSIPTEDAIRLSDFDNTRSGRNAYGNVGYANVHYNLCHCWDVGLGITYKVFRTHHLDVNPEGGFVASGFAADSSTSARSKWISYSIVADIGHTF